MKGSARFRIAAAAVLAVATVGAPAVAADFETDLARVTKALQENPSGVLTAARQACLNRRRFALQLYDQGQEARASRRLKTCFALLDIPETAPQAKVVAVKPEDLQAKAARELERALALEPDVANGLEIYRECAACHLPEAWGLHNGSVPQIAAQHRKVIIKQLADIRAGNRENWVMVPYSSAESIGGPQALADVAAYIESLEVSIDNAKGPGVDLELGGRLYADNCVRCHGATGEGDSERLIPRLQAQHYNYLVRQFEWIRDGKRRNADAEMATQIRDFGDRETHAVLDYVSRLTPPEALQAPPGWENPDFQR